MESIDILVDTFLRIYFEKRDIKDILSYLTDDVQWLGKSNNEAADGKAEVAELLKKYDADRTEGRRVRLYDKKTEVITPDVVMVRLTEQVFDVNRLYSFPMRCTLLCVKRADEWKIASVHISVSDEAAERDKFLSAEQTETMYFSIKKDIINLLLAMSTSVEESIEATLAKIGEFTGVSRAYIFENSEDGLCVNNTFEWCDEGIAPQKNNLQGISYEQDIDGYMNNFDGNGIFICRDIEDLPEKQQSLLRPQGIRSMLQCVMSYEGEVFGFIGFDICDSAQDDIDFNDNKIELLSYFSKIVAVCLIGERRYQRVSAYQEELKEILRNEEELRAIATRANDAKSEFLSRMSHDMRTPLNGILGNVELALDEEGLTETLKEQLHDIKLSGEFLLNLINDLLDVSRIEKGKIALNPQPYPYGEFISTMTGMIEPLCRQKNITLNMNPLEGTASIIVDKVRFQQIFFNVFSNAVKYTPDGGTIDHYTEISFPEEGILDCKCHIIDNGIGMSEEFQKHLFEPFVREEQAGCEDVQGTGLGLVISNHLAELMGGELVVKSELGKGTEVIIHCVVPIASATDEKTSEAAYIEISGIEGLRVLLFEDNNINANVAERILEKYGCEVVRAVNGKEGLDIFKMQPDGYFDIILMDMRMPVMDGIEATRCIRRVEGQYARSIPIIALTANAYCEDIKRCMDAGMNSHITKPFSPRELYNEIAEKTRHSFKADEGQKQ